MAYGHPLQQLANRAIKVNPNCISDKDKACRDVLAERVRDEELRTDLKILHRRDSNMTFQKMRDEADFLEENRQKAGDSKENKKGKKDKSGDAIGMKWK